MGKQLDLFETERKDRIEKIDELLQLTGKYRSSLEFKELIDFCAKFKTLSPYNAMLVQMQRPGAKYVLNASMWDKKYNAKIKLNSRPLIILVPFGPVDYLFDIDDTDIGDKSFFLKALEKPYETKGLIPDKIFDTLVKNLPMLGIKLESVIFGNQQNAEIRFCKSLPSIAYELKNIAKKTSKIITLPQFYQISVSNRNNKSDNFASIIHELGHYFCQHIIPPTNSWWNLRNIGHKFEEFEAETIAWLLCERLNIYNPSEQYLAGYINENDNIPDISIEMILKAVNQIEMLLEPVLLRNSLLAKKDESVKKQLKSN